MPTHAMRPHEWGTRGMGVILCMGHPPANTNVGMSLTSASGLPLVDQGGSPGSYTLSTVLTSTPTGTIDGGAVAVTIDDPSGPPPCEAHLDCIPQT